MLTQFSANHFDRITVPFITTAEQATSVVKSIDDAAAKGPQPIIFSTAVSNDIRQILSTCKGIVVDLIGTHVGQLEPAMGIPASGEPGRAHGLGNAARYRSRTGWPPSNTPWNTMTARACVQKAQVILVAPSRCGKTPTTMYLALQHGICRGGNRGEVARESSK
ncbi:kinase/pyrophosphorylase [Arthrobacter sp. D1-17]